MPPLIGYLRRQPAQCNVPSSTSPSPDFGAGAQVSARLQLGHTRMSRSSRNIFVNPRVPRSPGACLQNLSLHVAPLRSPGLCTCSRTTLGRPTTLERKRHAFVGCCRPVPQTTLDGTDEAHPPLPAAPSARVPQRRA